MEKRYTKINYMGNLKTDGEERYRDMLCGEDLKQMEKRDIEIIYMGRS